MPDTQQKLGRTLLKSMVMLREQKGDLSLEDVGGLFMQIASSLQGSSSIADQFMHQEIHRLAQYISDAKKEIFAIGTDEKTTTLNDASLHLDAVIKATEEASNSIMDAADKIQNAVAGVGGDKEKIIMDATSQLYEACNFQDITGQRINKVIKLLENIDERIEKLNALFGKEISEEQAEAPAGLTLKEAAADPSKVVIPTDAKALMNGPQLPGQAASQADIDAILNSFNK